MNRLEFQKLYNFTLVSTFMVAIAWIILQILPKYTNIIHFLKASAVQDSDLLAFKVLNYCKDAALMITWIIVSFNGKSSASDQDLEPEDQAEDQDKDGPDTALDDDLDST